MEIKDEVDDQLLNRLRLEEELSAVNGDVDFSDWAVDLVGAGPVVVDELEEGKRAKLSEYPEIDPDRLKECVKKYKDAGLKRRQMLSQTEKRLKDEESQGHETLDCSWLLFFTYNTGCNVGCI